MKTTEQKSEQRKITTNLYPKVAMMKLSDISDYPGSSKCSHVIISNGKVVHSCSSNYGLVKNEDFFGAFEDKLKEEHIDFKAIYKNVNDSHFAADYVLDGEMSVKTKKDKLQPKIRLINSYDGSAPKLGYLGYYRQICTNGLHAIKYEVDFRIKATAGNVSKAMPSIYQMIDKYQKVEGVKLIRRFQVLAEAPVKATELETIVKSIADSTKIFKFEKSETNISPSKNAQFVLDKIAAEADALSTVPNRWLVYNAFNEWLNNDERNKKYEHARVDFDTKLFAAVEAMN